MFRRLLPSFALAATTLFGAASASAEDLKIGVVDVQKVMEAVPAWTSAVNTLKGELSQKQKALEAKQAQLRQQKEQLDAKKTVVDPKQTAAEEQALMEGAKAFQLEYIQSQQELQAREAKLKEQMLGRIERIVNGLAEKGDFTFVFESGTAQNPKVLYTGSGVDLTKEVIAGYMGAFKDKPFDLTLPKPTGPGAAAEKPPAKGAKKP